MQSSFQPVPICAGYLSVRCQLHSCPLGFSLVLQGVWKPANDSSQAPWSAALWLGSASGRHWGKTGKLEEGRSLSVPCFVCSPLVLPHSGSGPGGRAASGLHSCGACPMAVAAMARLADAEHTGWALPAKSGKHLLTPSHSFLPFILPSLPKDSN